MATRDQKQQAPKKPRPPAKVNQMRRSTDIEDVKFPMRAVVGLVLFTGALVTSQWALTSGLRGDVAAIVVRMDEREKNETRDRETQKDMAAREEQARQKEVAAAEKIVNDRFAALDKRIDDIDRDYKLGDYDLKGLISARK